ncbi:ATP-dependent DNA helicase [Luteibacter phage vB_LflM-Pluto]|uniref:ATP-dependent DNA helicase n=1 Tax=Luteibacter phage vB_LflM-Pluto TaxID=2948611 RepID=A0A9E7SN64_9CAUD|nr:ATP-dependent DNA helicase [Luteibacter phage vB_LflM-Pluto]
MTTEVPFNEQQLAAIEAAVAWYQNWYSPTLGVPRKQVFFLAGFAGTGKTTVAMTIAKRCAGELFRVEFIAPTGKAASRLRQKGCATARTMHQFNYNLRGEDDEGNPIFRAKETLDAKPKLIVLDEASMVGEYEYHDLIAHNIPILALGDIGQLPPVKAAAAFTATHVDVLLDKIERQGKDSNIIRASMFVREGKKLPWREYDDVRVREGKPSTDDLLAHAVEDAQILCSYNNTRSYINNKIRAKLGFKSTLPEVGEKVVCRFNQHGYGIMNGEQGIVLDYTQVDTRREDVENIYDDEEDDGSRMVLRSLTDGRTLTVRFQRKSFSDDFEERKEFSKKPGAFDFGYALTVHSSQGSEWPRVLVIEESMRGIDYAKLMYTAVTRAQEVLTIYRDTSRY